MGSSDIKSLAFISEKKFLHTVNSDPRHGEGWDFADDGDIWYEALETENGNIDLSEYERFDTINEIYEFVRGEDGTRPFDVSGPDREMKKQEMMNDRWEVPGKLEKINEYLKRDPDVMRSEVNIDPTAEYDWVISQRSSNREGFDTKYTAHFAAYDADESGQNDAQFYFEKSWYDTPPEQVNLEDLFDL